MPRAGIIRSYGNSIFSFFSPQFKEPSYLFSIVSVLIYIPSNNLGGFPFLYTPHQHLSFVDFWMITILSSVRWYLMVLLIYTSLIMSSVECLFMCLFTIYLLCRHVYTDLAIFWSSCLFFLYIELYELFVYFIYWPLVSCIFCKYFLPFHRSSFHFVDGFLWYVKAFKFD